MLSIMLAFQIPEKFGCIVFKGLTSVDSLQSLWTPYNQVKKQKTKSL